MKTIKTFFFLLTVVVTAISCDAVDELTEIDVDTTITKDLVITVADGKTTFSESASISIDNEQVQDNLDRIEDLQITKLTYKILSVSGTEDVIASGSFTAASSTYPWFSAGDSASVNLTTAAADGTVAGGAPGQQQPQHDLPHNLRFRLPKVGVLVLSYLIHLRF